MQEENKILLSGVANNTTMDHNQQKITLPESIGSSPQKYKSPSPKRISTKSINKTPKMSIPLYRKMSKDLLMAPKKKFPSSRRLTKTAKAHKCDDERLKTAINDNGAMVNDGPRSNHRRNHVCIDLFKVKMSQVYPGGSSLEIDC